MKKIQSNYNGPLKIGIGGPVGSGKTTLLIELCREFKQNFEICAITNDIYTKEDAEFLNQQQILPSERIVGVETGGCPHTAIREDASINLTAIERLTRNFPDLDIVLIESGGDNLSATFSPELADLTIYMIDVGMGGDIPRKGGPAITKSDILVINKTDLAPHVEVDLEKMSLDTEVARSGKPFFFTKLKTDTGVQNVVAEALKLGGIRI